MAEGPAAYMQAREVFTQHACTRATQPQKFAWRRPRKPSEEQGYSSVHLMPCPLALCTGIIHERMCIQKKSQQHPHSLLCGTTILSRGPWSSATNALEVCLSLMILYAVSLEG